MASETCPLANFLNGAHVFLIIWPLWEVGISNKFLFFFAGVEETVGLVKGIGGKAYGYKCDLSDKEDVYRVAKKTQQEVGDVSCFII